MTSSQEMVQV